MSRRGLLLLAAALGAALAIAFALTERPGRTLVETSPVIRQARFRSTVTASGEIVASRYADIGSSVMGKIVSLRRASIPCRPKVKPPAPANSAGRSNPRRWPPGSS